MNRIREPEFRKFLDSESITMVIPLQWQFTIDTIKTVVSRILKSNLLLEIDRNQPALCLSSISLSMTASYTSHITMQVNGRAPLESKWSMIVILVVATSSHITRFISPRSPCRQATLCLVRLHWMEFIVWSQIKLFLTRDGQVLPN